MGSARTTVGNLRIGLVDGERNLLGVCGSVPGPRGAIIIIKEARKQ
jgi:large subunit ribosomal protein L3